jgi:hypothetical protein
LKLKFFSWAWGVVCGTPHWFPPCGPMVHIVETKAILEKGTKEKAAFLKLTSELWIFICNSL